MSAEEDGRRHPRGVYTAPYLSPTGQMLVVAIDSDGRRVAESPVPDGVSPDRVVHSLRSLLGALDPVGLEEEQAAAERRGELELLQ